MFLPGVCELYQGIIEIYVRRAVATNDPSVTDNLQHTAYRDTGREGGNCLSVRRPPRPHHYVTIMSSFFTTTTSSSQLSFGVPTTLCHPHHTGTREGRKMSLGEEVSWWSREIVRRSPRPHYVTIILRRSGT